MITHLQIQGALPAKAQLVASSTGGLLTAGTWSVQTLATYTLTGSTSSFTMSTSKGKCAVQSGQLTCGSGVSTASSFSAVGASQNTCYVLNLMNWFVVVIR